MLKRVYIHNYRCLVDFELQLGRRQLIMGGNGSGKSSVMDVLQFLRRIVILKHDLERRKILNQRTLWLNLPTQTFEIEASLDSSNYVYRLVIEPQSDPEQPRVSSESVKLNGQLIFDFHSGEVHLFDDQFRHKVQYPFEPSRSALATIDESRTNRNLSTFKEWFRHLLCFRINPYAMNARSESEDSYPWKDLSNFGSWYRHLRLSSRREDDALHKSLRESLDGFRSLQFEDFGEGTRLLQAEFEQENGRDFRLRFNQLSDGQRCLIGLYSILHFVIAKGYTVILDEPDNFIALREIQSWLSEVSASIDEGGGQALIISHHPELMNQWAPDYGIQLFRDGTGPVRVKQFNGQAYSMLSPSEVVARGWENE
jgi:predicted ATPase